MSLLFKALFIDTPLLAHQRNGARRGWREIFEPLLWLFWSDIQSVKTFEQLNIVDKSLLLSLLLSYFHRCVTARLARLTSFLCLYVPTPSFHLRTHPPLLYNPNLKPLAVLRHTSTTNSRITLSQFEHLVIATLSHVPSVAEIFNTISLCKLYRYFHQHCDDNQDQIRAPFRAIRCASRSEHFAPSDVCSPELRTPSWESERGACLSIALLPLAL